MLKSLLVLIVILYALFTGVPTSVPPEETPLPEAGLSADVEPPAEAEREELPAVEEFFPAPEPAPAPEPEPEIEPEPPAAPQEIPAEQPAQSEQEAVVGSWLWSLDTAPVISAMFDQELPDFVGAAVFTDLKLVVNIHLFEDGSFTATLEEESVWVWREEFFAQFEANMVALVETFIKESGMNMSVERFMEISGLSLSELMAELSDTLFSEETMQSMLSVDRGYYAVWDGKLSLYWGTLDTNSYDYYTLSGDTIIIEEGTGMIADYAGLSEYAEFASLIYPVVLTRAE